jgi:hypothetical protein
MSTLPNLAIQKKKAAVITKTNMTSTVVEAMTGTRENIQSTGEATSIVRGLFHHQILRQQRLLRLVAVLHRHAPAHHLLVIEKVAIQLKNTQMARENEVEAAQELTKSIVARIESDLALEIVQVVTKRVANEIRTVNIALRPKVKLTIKSLHHKRQKQII